MKKNIIAALFAFICTLPAMAQQDTSEYTQKKYISKKGDTLLYRMLYPSDYGTRKKYPLIVFLHGAGERGNDNEKQLTHGAGLFLEEANRRDYPAIVVFPQCPEGDYWSSVKIKRVPGQALDLDFNYPEEPTTPLRLVMDLIRHLPKMEAVDEKRIYVMGLSMGGMGTFELLAREPKKIAAAIPICGGGNPADCEKYAGEVPLWIFHGAKDEVVPVSYSRTMQARLKELGADVRYTEYPEAGHNSWDQAFAEPELLQWLFGHGK